MKIVVIGANRGIGLEFCEQYAEFADYEIYALCRKASPELKKLRLKYIENIDVSNENDLRKVASELPSGIDLIVHVSGIAKADNLENTSPEQIMHMFNVNTMGPLRTVQAFKSKMNKKESKIAFLTSQMGSIEDNSSGNYYAYRISKTALNMLCKNLSLDLSEKNITILPLHPGYVSTDMTSHKGAIDTRESVIGLRKVIQNSRIQDSGKFLNYKNEELPW